MKLGDLLKMAREIRGMSLRDVERETGISNALLSQIETGHVKQPGFQNVVKIARALNVKLDTLADHSVVDLKKVLREIKGKGTTKACDHKGYVGHCPRCHADIPRIK